MARKKEYIARFLQSSGALFVRDVLRIGRTNEVLILGYHRILDIGDEDRYPFDPELVSTDPEGFHRQMSYLRRRWTPITHDALIDAVDGKTRLPRRAVVVTFDDGFDDNYHFAFPVLRDLNVPATFFVSTDYLDSGKPFWFERLAHLLFQIKSADLVVPELDLRLSLNDVAARREAAQRLLVKLKGIDDADRLSVLAALENRHRGDVDLSKQPLSRPMTWEQVQEMSRGGMQFGSHTASHPVLARLNREQIDHELRHSREQLEAKLSCPVTVMSYPNGLAVDINQLVKDAAVKAGYRMAMSYIKGINHLASLDRYCMRRQPVERYMSWAFLRSSMAWPKFFF